MQCKREEFRLGKIGNDSLKQTWENPLYAISTADLKESMVGAMTISERCFQGFTTMMTKKFCRKCLRTLGFANHTSSGHLLDFI